MYLLSYGIAVVAMLVAALYLFMRLRPFIATTTILLGSLLVVYGPLSLIFTFFSGEYGLPVRILEDAGGVAGGVCAGVVIRWAVADRR